MARHSGTVRLQHVKPGQGSGEGKRLTVPKTIADFLPDDMEFTVELTEEGILYRPVDSHRATMVEVPEWLVNARVKDRRRALDKESPPVLQ